MIFKLGVPYIGFKKIILAFLFLKFILNPLIRNQIMSF